MKPCVRTLNKSILQFIAICFVLMFSSSFIYGDETKDGLSIQNVYVSYYAKEERLHVMFAVLNTGDKEVMILTENLNTGFIDDSGKRVFEIGAGITARYKDYKIIQSLYRFDPVTLKPKEATLIRHNVKKKLMDVDEETEFVVRYKVNKDFGMRHNAWFGSIESTPVKPRIIK